MLIVAEHQEEARTGPTRGRLADALKGRRGRPPRPVGKTTSYFETLPVPRKGPRPARSELGPKTSPSPAARETPDPLPGKARLAQPSEPILVPKLRIKIADFPYLH